MEEEDLSSNGGIDDPAEGSTCSRWTLAGERAQETDHIGSDHIGSDHIGPYVM